MYLLDALAHTVLRELIEETVLASIIAMPDTLFVTSTQLIEGSILFGIVVSLGAGILPAYRAARIEPAIVLREN